MSGNIRVDITDVLADPDFACVPGECFAVHAAESVGANGRATDTPAETDIGALPWTAVVVAGSADLTVEAEASRVADTISVYTTFPLGLPRAAAAADMVRWRGAVYRVIRVADWGGWGVGFVVATCSLTAPVEPG